MKIVTLGCVIIILPHPHADCLLPKRWIRNLGTVQEAHRDFHPIHEISPQVSRNLWSSNYTLTSKQVWAHYQQTPSKHARTNSAKPAWLACHAGLGHDELMVGYLIFTLEHLSRFKCRYFQIFTQANFWLHISAFNWQWLEIKKYFLQYQYQVEYCDSQYRNDTLVKNKYTTHQTPASLVDEWIDLYPQP